MPACNVAAECDNGRGGYECMHVRVQNKQQGGNIVPRSMDDSRALPAIETPHVVMEDAGEDLDAGPNHVHPVGPLMEPSPGYCARACQTELCTDPGMVCSFDDGFCRPGCDEVRPSCAAGQACDFAKKRCYELTGSCTSAGQCPELDERLSKRGAVTCEDQRCRYRSNPPDRVQAFQSAITSDGLHKLAVQSPQPGERILTTRLPGFAFQFDVPAQVIVATILIREIKNLEDGAAAAVWTAYLDGRDALKGVTLAAGGNMKTGMWRPFAGALPTLPEDTQLYFFVLGYDQGERVAQSELIPFSVGLPRPKPGDACEYDGWFCGSEVCKDSKTCTLGSGLVCNDRHCRTPCLSDDDCASEGRSCSEPMVSGVLARLCM